MYDIRDRYVFTDLKPETCFECCNEHFAKDLNYANKGYGKIKFKGKYLLTQKDGSGEIESFANG